MSEIGAASGMVDTDHRKRLLVVAAEPYRASLAPYLAHRGTQYDVEVVALSAIGARTPAQPVPAALRAYIHDRYTDEKAGPLAGVLLVGDDTSPDTADEIPIGAYPAGIKGPAPQASDAYYGDMTADPGVEIPVGRWPVQDREALDRLVAKQIAYETEAAPRHRHTIGVYGGIAGFGVLQDLAIEARIAEAVRSIPPHYPLRAHYEDPNSLFYSAGTDIFSFMNAGAFILTVASHGSPDRLQIKPPLSNQSADKIQIRGQLPILNLLACSAGCFAQRDCLGERLLLLRHGPIAVFGSNAVISPILLDPFGSELARALAVQGETLGQVFARAARSVEAADSLLARIAAELPESLQADAHLPGGISLASVVQATQLTLLGDPLTPFQTAIEGPAATDVRAHLPQPTRPMAERITHTTPPPAVQRGIDSRTLGSTDLATVLHLLDYFLFRAEAMVGNDPAGQAFLAQHDLTFPQPGATTIQDGVIHIPMHGSISTALLPKPVRAWLLGQHAATQGTVHIANLQFRVALNQGKLLLDDIAGIEVEIPGKRYAVQHVTVDFTAPAGQRVPTPALVETVPAAVHTQVETLNAALVKRFAGDIRIQIERHITAAPVEGNGRYFYTLRQPVRDHKGATQRLAWLHPVLLDQPPQFTPHGAILPAGFGHEPVSVDGVGNDARIVIREQPVGARKANYLYIPTTAETPGAVPIDEQVAIQQLLGLKRTPVPINIGQNLPMFALALLPEDFIDTTVDLTRINVPLGDDPLFRTRPESLDGSATANDNDSESGGSSDGLGDIPDGAEFCFVVDASGSAGYPLMNAWPLVPAALTKMLAPYNALVRGLIKMNTEVSVVVAQGLVPELRLPPETLSGSGVDDLFHTFGNITYRGDRAPLASALALCREQLTQSGNENIIQGIVVLTDTAGAAEAALPATPNVHVQVIAPELIEQQMRLGSVTVHFAQPTVAQIKSAMATRLAEGELSPERVAQIADMLAPLQLRWDGADHAQATAHQQLTHAILEALRTDDAARLQVLLATALQEQHSEPMLEVVVAAIPLLPALNAAQLLPNLHDPLHPRHDRPLRERTVETLGALARQGHAEALAQLHALRKGNDPILQPAALRALGQWQRSANSTSCGPALYREAVKAPDLVQMDDVRRCGVNQGTLRTLLYLIDFGALTQQAGAIAVAGELLIDTFTPPEGVNWGYEHSMIRSALGRQLDIGLHRRAACRALALIDNSDTADCEK